MNNTAINSSKSNFPLAEAMLHPLLDFSEELIPSNKSLRYTDGQLHINDRQIRLVSVADLFTETKTPDTYPAYIAEPMLDHDLQSFRSPNQSLILKNGKFDGFRRQDLAYLNPREIVETTLDTLPATIQDSCQVAKISQSRSQFTICIVSKNHFAEPRVGDIVEAGLQITSFSNGARATRVEAYLRRLACLNGLTQRECIKNGGGRRTRRLKVVGDVEAAKFEQRDQLSGLITETMEGLNVRLGAIANIESEPANVADLVEQILRQGRLFSNTLMNRILEAWEVEGREDTLYGALNALTRVATHDTEITTRQAGGLARLAGVLAGQSLHICPHCWSLTPSH